MIDVGTSNMDLISKNILLDIITETWRFCGLFERVLSKLDAGEQEKYRSQFRWFLKKLQDSLTLSDLRIENIEGSLYDAGIAATAINLDEFSSEDVLLIEKMIEPIIMGPEGIVRTGVVVLRRADQ